MTCSHHDIPPAHHVRLIQSKHIHHPNMMSWRYIMVRTCHTSMRWWRFLLCINLTWWAGGISWWEHVIFQIPAAHHVRLIQSKYLHHLIEVWHVLTMIYLQLIMLDWYKTSIFIISLKYDLFSPWYRYIMVRTSHTSMRWWTCLLCINLTWWAGGISWWEHVILQWDDEDTCFCINLTYDMFSPWYTCSSSC
jgi:hypothetical protein